MANGRPSLLAASAWSSESGGCELAADYQTQRGSTRHVRGHTDRLNGRLNSVLTHAERGQEEEE